MILGNDLIVEGGLKISAGVYVLNNTFCLMMTLAKIIAT